MQHQAKKRFGQNFLIDENIIQRIVDSINPQHDDNIIEIGPGLGAITRLLLQRTDKLNVIELDRDIIPKLLFNCRNDGTPIIHEMDVLKFNFKDFRENTGSQKKLRVVGNLPYNISTPVLFLLLKDREVIQDMHFMLQKEVVDRITAQPGSRTYGRLSVMIQTYFNAASLFQVPAYAFSPAPKVESAILRLVPDNSFSQHINNHKAYEELIRQSFSQRRKTLKNNLKNLCSAEHIIAAGIDPGQRAEEISIEFFLKLHVQISSD
ncbi:MAG: 16S rRNA (adenine(1518)-N(6)/adenine(1519)-N(6))-dimethyltransferase RsmA [Gammaproteobacteria bacterium]|nr:16S rRNA (adenine(1518)-N(6)/adenine(1519)-N(6))-dimethyltransferase RsmA [Gammaproteobacteria bacterium]MCW8922382.1 16S rRNA (adenine(1518)-N(6)/adenine(1519)-N(6))-dimethyltransferase RsmA [Gammaproteobacteria bacterium]